MCRGGGQVVSVLAFYSDNPSSNPAEANSFSLKCAFEKNEVEAIRQVCSSVLSPV